MLAEWTARFKDIALCAWWFTIMVGAVGLGAAAVVGLFGTLFGGVDKLTGKPA